MPKRSVRRIGLLLLVACFVVGSIPHVSADPQNPQSPSYTFDESVIGVGGMNQSSSTSYQIETGIGDIGIGNSASSNYQIDAGSKTSPDPTLSFIVNTVPVLSDFTPTIGTVTTSTFTVSNYTSYGYAIAIFGSPPTNDGHSITPISPGSAPYTVASTPGIEQFGINLVANVSTPGSPISPGSAGANPDHQQYPVGGQFGYGTPTANYSVNNEYRYASGEAVATGPKSSGVTTYTMTYLVNVNPLTKGGQYITDLTLIATGTY